MRIGKKTNVRRLLTAIKQQNMFVADVAAVTPTSSTCPQHYLPKMSALQVAPPLYFLFTRVSSFYPSTPRIILIGILGDDMYIV